jgi:[ribosomal protein S5]-alanine N-acetyltransferase
MKQKILKTDRLFLKSIEIQDLKNIHELLSLPETDQYNTLGIPENLSQTENIIGGWIAKRENYLGYTFAVELINDKTFIGLMGINLGKEKYQKAKVWFKFHSHFWSNGYCTEALRKIISFGFTDLKLHRIEAGCAIENIASIAVMEKVGMIKEGVRRKNLPLKTGWSDNFEYAILSTDQLK